MLDKILDFFKPGDHSVASRMTNQMLLDELVDHFKMQLKEHSFDTRILYPMAFRVYMAPSDYKRLELDLPFVMETALKKIYKIIEEKGKGGKYDTRPPAKEWLFRFSPCYTKEVDKEEVLVAPGKIVSQTLLYSDATSENVFEESNIPSSVRCVNSNRKYQNLNLDALNNLDIRNEGTFRFRFDPTGSSPTSQEVPTYATISYSLNGKQRAHKMQDETIYISGNTDNRSGRQIIKIDSPEVEVSHVQIRYFEAEQKFRIAAFHPARVNERPLPISVGSPEWQDLANNSNILLNSVQLKVTFNITKS
ncbi:MAG: hypothetical protein J5642_06485 [Bacteroidales bacterium]|nr:hypothetical protein [Bacteroidales bacterium]